MSRRRSSLGIIMWDTLPDPGPRFQLGKRIAEGISGDVYEALDIQEGSRPVAIKITGINDESLEDLEEEFNVLNKFCSHPNLPDFYGIYRKRTRDSDQIWFVMELCEGGTVVDFVRGLVKKDHYLSETHIAYILKEVVTAAKHLHENKVMHRDIRGTNVLLTKNGEIRLVDFGLARELKSAQGRCYTSIGSPAWMAPEVVTAEHQRHKNREVYDNRIDVWSLGILAIELADGKAPLEDIHPTRALFQIVHNPPPTVQRPAKWTQLFNDFIAECLEKNPENRPCMEEIYQHPFFELIPVRSAHFPNEIRALMDRVKDRQRDKHNEALVRSNYLKEKQQVDSERMYLQDLAALEHASEDMVLEQLQNRLKRGECYSFIGDVLLYLNPSERLPFFSDEVQRQYHNKSRSDNPPHVYAIADAAYQDAFHHNEVQHAIMSGESASGKTLNMINMINHLLQLGFVTSVNRTIKDRVMKCLAILHTMGNACTPINSNSTRHMMNVQVTYTRTGRTSGAIFWLYQLEKWRITTNDKRQGNFHLFYYFYDNMNAKKLLEKYGLEGGRCLRFLRSLNTPSGCIPFGLASSDPKAVAENVKHYETFVANLKELEFSEDDIETVQNILAAVLLLGELNFKDAGSGRAGLENPAVAAAISRLLGVDEKKLAWALVNYCLVSKGQAQPRHQSPAEAEEARDALARALYGRLVDWVVNNINVKLSFSRSVYGDTHMISVTDLFGFECFQHNSMEQLIVNSLNEQMQFHYTQKIFVCEMQERIEEEVRNVENLTFYNNRPTVDLLMAKPYGILWLIDEASRSGRGADYIVDAIPKSPFCQIGQGGEFSVAHYTGKVTYDANNFSEKNREFVPPEITETMRLSNNPILTEMFTNQLSRTGNLTSSVVNSSVAEKAPDGRRNSKWLACVIAEKQAHTNRPFNNTSRAHFSQTRRMRTATAAYRATCLELLRNINQGGCHFIRCIRPELTGQPRGFQPEVVRQQLRALNVVDTVRARQYGYPCRVTFSEFLKRYKFLAFDFEETVDETADNCRLLMVRLKLEGYAMGKNKVFLTYYNEQYLSRLYETQVKKIVKVQAMMRTFLARRRVKDAPSKKPGALAGMIQISIDDGTSDSIFADDGSVLPKTDRFRKPLESVLDYLEDPDEEEGDTKGN